MWKNAWAATLLSAVIQCDTLGTAETLGYSPYSLKIVTYEVTSKTNEALQLQLPSNEVAVEWDSSGPYHVQDNLLHISTRSEIIKEEVRQ